MKWNSWQSFICLLALIFVFLPGAPRQEADPLWRPEPPDPQQMQDLERLSSWLTRSPRPGVGYRAALPEDVRTAIRERHNAFQLLTSYNTREARRELLETVPYGDAIFEAARKHGVDSLLLAAVVEAESNFVPHVVSPVGAVGLTQLMPATAQSYGLSDLRNPTGNLDVGARYLRWLLDQFDGDLELALAGYNAGPGAVSRYGGIPPYRETRGYVEKVLSIYFNHHRALLSASSAGNALLLSSASVEVVGG